MSPVRLASANDLQKLASVERSAASPFAEVGLAWIAAGRLTEPALLAAMCGDRTLWVAVDQADEPVGFLAAHVMDGQFYIAEVSVARPYQRRGFGAALVAAAVNQPRARGFQNVTVTTYRDLPWNGPFYSKLGFIEISAEKLGPAHTQKLRAEAEAGHDPSRRCAMARSL